MKSENSLALADYPLTLSYQFICLLSSFFLVAFGQPAWLPWNGILSSMIGFAFFWRVLIAYPKAIQRFNLGTCWFGAVQLVQLSWFTSHPYLYIYFVYFLLALILGLQFGLLSLFIQAKIFSYSSLLNTLVIYLPLAGMWTLLEWMRLFIFSGFSWNPIGISLTGNLYPLQAASLVGIFGLSFWVILGNLFALWFWIKRNYSSFAVCIIVFALPYVYGAFHLYYYDKLQTSTTPILSILLVQTAFAPEESQEFADKKNLSLQVIEEWKTILTILSKNKKNSSDLIVFPEFVVPFGTYSDLYPLIKIKKIFYEIFGEQSLQFLPPLDYPFFSLQYTMVGPQLLVNNAYLVQAIANLFHADVLIGLEDAEDVAGNREYYSSAIFIRPQEDKNQFYAARYAKRILVPMGEYIPFDFCKKLAEKYGVFSSFTCGKEAIIMTSHGIPFSPSICYEETFGNLMRDGKNKGAQLLVNLTNDVWYPNSHLAQQHLDHSRLRTVENGMPLVRACNTGITAAIDSFGRNIAVLGGDSPQNAEWIADSLLVDVPIITYSTLYSLTGDLLIIGISLFLLVLFFNKLF